MTRRYGILALAILTLLLVNLGWQEEPSPISPERSATPSPADVQLPAEPGSPPPRMSNAEGMDGKSKAVPSSWQAMPDELINQLASEISDSELPLAQRVSNLEATEAGWLSEGESLIRLQGRYAPALDQLAQENEQLPLAERLDALSRLQDQWAADHPDLAVDLFNPDARLQQARQLWGDEELPPVPVTSCPQSRLKPRWRLPGRASSSWINAAATSESWPSSSSNWRPANNRWILRCGNSTKRRC